MMTKLQNKLDLGDPVFANLVEQCSTLIEAGHLQQAIELIDNQPEYADRLRRLLPAIEALASLDAPLGDSLDGTPQPVRQLGDYKILREIGRGGMGIVYEAEQISLRRRVALKVLPLAATLSEQQLNRFKNEARAAATLKHPHIVGVYSVGVERGVHYYAMELVDGQSLAEAIGEMREKRGGRMQDAGGRDQRSNAAPHPSIPNPLDEMRGRDTGDGGQGLEPAPPGSPEFQSEHTNPLEERNLGVPGEASVSPYSPSPVPRPPQAKLDTIAALSTVRNTDTPAYYREVARLIADAADALDYAHSQGVVHRDIKPGNLLVDRQSRIWVTDFGLARLETDTGVTLTGDVLGTLRYMSPEQAAGKPGLVDHRTDIHALRATLYELLALRPAFDSDDRAELLRRIVGDSPPALRRRDTRIPADLETITAKALEKEPADRYESAGLMAADLRAFMEHRPITARPPSVAMRLQKWGKRHVALVAAALLFTLTAAVGLAISAWLLRQANAQTLAEKTQAEANLATAEDNLQVAVAAIDGLLREFAEDAHHHGQLHHADTMLNDAIDAYGRVLQHTDDPAVVIKLATTHAALGGVELEAEHRDSALEHVAAGLKLLDDLPDDQRESRDAKSGRAKLAGLRGSVLQEQEDFAGAAQWLTESTALREALAKNPSDEAEDNNRQGDLLQALKAQAELQLQQHDLPAARANLDRCVAICDSREKALQGGPWWLDQRSDLHQLAAQLATERGDYEAAVAALTAAVETQKNALRCLPDSKRYQKDLRECHQQLATALFHAGKFEQAGEEVATVVAQFPAELSAYIAGYDLLLDCADQTTGALAEKLIARAGLLLERAPVAEYLPADDRRALAWRLATCPYTEFRDGERAKTMSSYLCFRGFFDPANLQTHSAALRAEGDVKGSKTMAQMAMSIPKQRNPGYQPTGAQLVLWALGEAAQQTEYSAEAWSKASAWREANEPLTDRGLRALFDEAEELFADGELIAGVIADTNAEEKTKETEEPAR